MPKDLPESLRNKYLRKATDKVSKDTKESLEYIKSKGLSVSFERCSTENEAQHIYTIARDMWEADGYYDQPAEFTRFSERESRFTNAIFGGTNA
jgi:hypothetical protein